MTTLAKHFAATPGKMPSGNQPAFIVHAGVSQRRRRYRQR